MKKPLNERPFFMETLLLMATLFWGASFVWCEDIANTGIDTNAYVSIRYALAVLVMLPFFWKDVRPSNDAADVLGNIAAHKGGGIMPLGGSTEDTGSHKGYGWAMVCELFSSILSLGTTSDQTGKGGKGGICHGFLAIDPGIFGDAEGIKAHLSAYLEALRNSPKADGQTRIYTHGEKEVEAQARLMAEGIPVNDNTMVEVLELCNYLELDFSKYFGSYMPQTGGDFKGNFY